MRQKNYIITALLAAQLCAPTFAEVPDNLDVNLNYGTLTGKNTFTQDGITYQAVDPASVETCFKELETEIKRKATKGIKKLNFLARGPLTRLVNLGSAKRLLNSTTFKTIVHINIESGQKLNEEQAHDITTNKTLEAKPDAYYVVFRGTTFTKAPSKGKVLNCPINFKSMILTCKVKK